MQASVACVPVVHLFRPCDLKLDPMILIYELDPYCLEICKWTSYVKSVESYRLTDRQTYIQNRQKLWTTPIRRSSKIKLINPFGNYYWIGAIFQKFESRSLSVTVSAVGCSDLVPPSDAWLKRSDNVATVGCYMTRQTWILTCDHNGRWTGTFGNCTQRTTTYLHTLVNNNVA